MEHLNEQRCLRILELPDGATIDEISHAYHLLMRVYGNAEGSFTAPSMDEFSAEARTQALNQIEAAYAELCRIHTQTQRLVHPPAPVLEAHLPVDGSILRGVRESVNISLEHLASQTHIRLDYLSAMEDERFGDIPLPPVILRGFISAYVTEVGLNPDQVVPAYMQRYQQWQARKSK